MKNLHSKTMRLHWLIVLMSVFFLTGSAIMVDPTRPPDALLPANKGNTIKGELQVSAIFIYPDTRFAIIGGQQAVKGDKVGEYTITNIQRDTVELIGSQGNSIVLSLLPQVKKMR